MLVHEGGLAIETRAAPDAPAALRTVVQLDGDRVTTVALGAIAGLSADDRRRLAARHLADVQARSVGLLADGQLGLRRLRHGILAAVAGLELVSAAGHVSVHSFFAGSDWRGFLRDQILGLILLGCRQAAPRVLPRLLRLIHGRTARAMAEAHRQQTRQSLLSGQAAR
jgi:hypothetical protein